MKEFDNQYSDTIEQLQAKVQALTDENRLLKQRMDEAGIAYNDIESDNNSNVIDLYDPNQGARIKEFEVTDKIASDFFMMFCRGRKDVFDLRYTNPKTGKNGYYTQCLRITFVSYLSLILIIMQRAQGRMITLILMTVGKKK